ncbi:MAG: ABC transporter ATP-binding protein [Magnetococcales bacterium]|nr:ABC transporter ATP-binding protein [Magnetococcales bacterium]MBF0116154.1 ABC transporter ATP-binding protein [Magnetococcales bacterium]
MKNPLLETRDLGFHHDNGTQALAKISLTIQHRERILLLGANGSGKSTLLQLLAAALTPTSGLILLDGSPISTSNPEQLRARTGLLFQDPEDMLFMPTVQEDVAFAPLNLGIPKPQRETQVRQIMEHLQIWHLRHRPAHQLSGGEKRRVALAAALAIQPDLLLLDEPTTALDPQGRYTLNTLLDQLDCAWIIASHEPAWMLPPCQRVILLHAGQMVADGPAEQVLQDRAALQRSGLLPEAPFLNCPRCGTDLYCTHS